MTTEPVRNAFEAEPRQQHTPCQLLERLQAQCPVRIPHGQRTLQRRLKEWRREAAHRMVFGTMTADADVAPGDGQGRLISNRANDCLSDREGGAKQPCGFAAALGRRRRVAHNSTGPISPSINLQIRKGAAARRRINEATGARLVRQRFTSREHSPVRQYAFQSRLPRYSQPAPSRITAACASAATCC